MFDACFSQQSDSSRTRSVSQRAFACAPTKWSVELVEPITGQEQNFSGRQHRHLQRSTLKNLAPQLGIEQRISREKIQIGSPKTAGCLCLITWGCAATKRGNRSRFGRVIFTCRSEHCSFKQSGCEHATGESEREPGFAAGTCALLGTRTRDSAACNWPMQRRGGGR